MSAESKAYRLQIDADARLAAAAGGVARFVAEAAGLTSEAAADLQESVMAVCVAGFENLGERRVQLTVTVERFPDRIEAAVAHKPDASPALGFDRIPGLAGAAGKAAARSGVDRIQCEARAGMAITRLIKYLGDAPPLA